MNSFGFSTCGSCFVSFIPTISIEGYLGKISGEGTFLDTTDQEESITSLKNNLNFELKTTHSDGTENIYQIHMNLSEITSEYEMSMI